MAILGATTASAGRPIRCDEVGINLLHSTRCASRDGGSCTCEPSYQGQVYSRLHRDNIRRCFKSIEEARRWREETILTLQEPGALGPGDVFLSHAAKSWLEAAKAGVVRTRSGTPFKPSALRSYEDSIKRFLMPRLGRVRLSELTRVQVQDVIDELVAVGYAPSTVRNAVLPLRSICRRAFDREEIPSNPTLRLDLPIDRRRRDRVAPPTEVRALLDVLPPHLRLIWTVAIYTGLRRGELQALRWDCVDLDVGIIRVERSWDRIAGFIDPKSRAAIRNVPIPGELRNALKRRRLEQGRGGEGFVLGDGDTPFDPSNSIRAAQRTWERAGLDKLGYHDARHTYASLMIAAGVNAKTLSIYMGHSSIVMTIDRYGHLFPGNERDSAAKLDAYLDRAIEMPAADVVAMHG